MAFVLMGFCPFSLSATVPSAKSLYSQWLTTLVENGTARPEIFGRAVAGSTRQQSDQAAERLGSSTIEKRTPALWRFSSDTWRQHSSASFRVLKGPLTWAEPSTSLWKFIEPNSPPITQKLLPLVMGSSCYSAA